MSRNKNKNQLIRVIVLLLLLVSVLLLHPKTTNALATGLPFGGRILFFTPPIIALVINCPALSHVLNLGHGPKILHLMLPPAQPRAFYNFYTPGVAALGSYVPTPVPFNCPFQPIFPSVYFGTSAR